MTTPVVDPVTTIATTGAPYLAVDVKPDLVPGTFTVDVSEVGGDDLIGWSSDGPGDWVNIVCDVTSARTQRGALQQQGNLTQTEAGTAVLTLTDTERRFDPLANGDAIHKGTPLRLRAWGYRNGGAGPRWDAVLFTGAVDTPAVQYNLTGPPTVTITATDVIGRLVAWESEGRPDPGVGGGDNLLGRVVRVLAEVNAGISVSPDSDQLYDATLAATVLDKPWPIITAAMKAEQGRVWVDSANRLVVRARDSELAGTVRGTLSDRHGEAPLGVHCCLAGGVPTYRPDAVVNRVLATRRIPTVPGQTAPTSVEVRVDDTYSQTRYSTQTLNAGALDVETDAQVQRWATAIVLDSAAPTVQVDELLPAPWGNPYSAPADPNVWEAVCLTDVGDRWLYRVHPQLGDPVARALGVLGIGHDITPDGWSITWATVDAPEPGVANPSGYFTIGLSEVGGPDVLALFGGQPPARLFGDVDGGGANQGMISERLDGGTATSQQYEAPVDGGGARS